MQFAGSHILSVEQFERADIERVFEVADRIHVARLGKRAAVVTPQSHSMNDVVAIMTGAMKVPEEEQQLTPVR